MPCTPACRGWERARRGGAPPWGGGRGGTPPPPPQRGRVPLVGGGGKGLGGAGRLHGAADGEDPSHRLQLAEETRQLLDAGGLQGGGDGGGGGGGLPGG